MRRATPEQAIKLAMIRLLLLLVVGILLLSLSALAFADSRRPSRERKEMVKERVHEAEPIDNGMARPGTKKGQVRRHAKRKMEWMEEMMEEEQRAQETDE